MHITVNGKPHEVAPNCTLCELLEQLELGGKRIAVEMNGEIVPKSEHASTRLAAQTRLEIVVAVGGG